MSLAAMLARARRTLRPGRVSSARTVNGSIGTGRSSSRVSRATRIGCSVGSISTAYPARMATGPPCRKFGFQGPRAASVGRKASPSRSKMLTCSPGRGVLDSRLGGLARVVDHQLDVDLDAATVAELGDPAQEARGE